MLSKTSFVVVIAIIAFALEACRQYLVNYGALAADSNLNHAWDIATTAAPAAMVVVMVVVDVVKKHRNTNARRSWRDIR